MDRLQQFGETMSEEQTKKRREDIKKATRQNEFQAMQRDIKFLKALAEGATMSEAAQLVAGKKLTVPRSSAHVRMERIKAKAPELLEKCGLGEKQLVENFLKPLLSATEVKVFNDKEKGIIYSDPLVAWGPRQTGLDMAFKLHGSYAKQEEEKPDTPNSIQVIIIDVSREDRHPVAAEAITTQ